MFKLFFILFISLNIYAQEAAKESNLSIAIGIDEVIKLQYKYNTKVQIGNQKIVSLILAPSRREITFRGKNAGKTSVTVRDAAGDIRDKFIVNVSADGTSQIVRELRDLIGNIEGIEVLIKGGKVVVEGMIVVPGDIGRINKVLGQYREVLPLIELSPQTQRVIARKMQEEINKNNMKDVTVRIVNGDFWIEGVVNSEQKKAVADQIAKQYLPDRLESLAAQSGGSGFQAKERYAIVNFVSVNEKKDPEPPAKLVKISAQFVELSKDYQKIFGFSWNPTLTSGGSISFGKTDSGDVTTNESDTLSGTIASLFPKLSSARQAGYARVIQSAMLITKDRKQASVNKSRTVPYSIGAGDLQTTGNATYEFSLSVTPSIGDKEIVNLDSMTITVKLPSAKANGGQPTNTNNSITTNVAVKSKESAAIGGIVQSSSTTNYDKDVQPSSPEEGTQLLFNLGRGKSYSTDKAQFVVFVTPEIIESAADGTNEIRKKFRKRER
jgi:pilus assembly protein CpaC